MFDPSSFANPTPLAHADTSRDVLPRGGTSQWRPTRFNLYDPEIRNARGFNVWPEVYFSGSENVTEFLEVVRRPNNSRNDYKGNYQNSRQGNQWFESRNRFQNDDRRFDDMGYQLRNRGQNDDFSKGDQRNRGSNENFSKGSRKQIKRLNVLKVSAIKDNNTVESIIGEKVNCAMIKDLILSSQDQLIEEQGIDPELGHIYKYLEIPEDSSVNAAIWFSSSKKTLNCPEVNTRFVYGMRQIGKCFSAGFKLCGTLNLPRLSKTAYSNHENKLMLVNYQCKKQLLNFFLVLHPTKNKIVECGISVDGTWQRRGYSSMNGCVAALSVDTGKVVDIEIMSSYCPTCRKISKMPRSIESETFGADHVCHSSFQGSALKMEAVGATRIFQRSIVKRGLKYAHYYFGGDSKGFNSVKDTYEKDSVTKYEYIGHVQKRVGARLRKLKSKNKNLSGKGKLTDYFIDRLQNYYGIAVRSNVRNLSGLQQNVIEALFHCSSSVEKPMHGQCPIGKDSWCYYQRALSCGKKPNEKYKGLSNEVLNTIKPTYLELCTKELLTKCLHGKTQHSNECLNGVIWQRVPKEVFVCLKILKSGALDAVIQFNDGYKGCVEIFKKT
ncbi:uncharacterized protein TNCV_3883811 [Trichonephila clavipes]|nr:uncharacterized protein TNCV_3883811 [Trichonephila clavipes]